jgi:hypothetical protein
MIDTTYYPGTFNHTDTDRIREGYRIRVVVDEEAESPLEWGDHITTNSDEYKRWFAGDVYRVIVERSETYTNGRSELTVWEEVDSLGSCYLDSDYTGVTVASEIAPDSVKRN